MILASRRLDPLSLILTMTAIAALPASELSAQVTTAHPLKLAPRPTAAAITEADLMTRIYIFADDSMMGRQAGREGNAKGTAYIARELARLGIEPAGDDGTYFQNLPYVVRRYTGRSTLHVDGNALRWMDHFLALPGGAAPAPIERAQVVFGGVAGDTARMISAEEATGRFVILVPGETPQGGRGRGRGGFAGVAVASQRLARAAAIATINLHTYSPGARTLMTNPPGSLGGGRGGRGGAEIPGPPPANLSITREAARIMFGRAVDGMTPGTTGGIVTARLDFVEQPVPEFGRNVVGIIRGSDLALAGQYVAIGAHNDHVGFNANPVDHDSARAAATAALATQMAGGELRALSTEERAAIRVNVDSLRRLRPARLDSIRNGADDDGSGSMAMLEIAEAIAAAPTRPRRSILFVWHTGEEGGLSGSRYFVDNPTVPRDSIVVQINLDMIGRGRATDIPGGGPDYLAVVGSRRLSSELGDLVASVNTDLEQPFRLDHRFDEETTWPGYNNIYGRSDHANYARHNIPIAFFFTGLHQDYHQVTDEPQYLDYPHYAAVTKYLHRVVIEIADRERRIRVDRAVS